jgi:formylglycine-generating enzyme required for sulfatase activity
MPRGIEPDGLISLPGGSFSMGDAMGLKYEKPVHPVSVSPFAISAREVSGREWASVMGHGPEGLPSEPELAVEFITWFEAIEYCNTLSRLKGLRPAYEVDGESVRWIRQSPGYRLPTEAEWEYAARAGSGSRYSGGEIPAEVAIFRAEGPAKPGMRAPNAFGLYDMSGNVVEWCWDWFAPFDASIQDNPSGPGTGTERVIRGGSWYGLDRSITVSARASSHPANRQRGIGLRVARSIFP